MSHSSPGPPLVASFPSISQEEFAAACISFTHRCYDRLSGTDWLSVQYDGIGLHITKGVETPDAAHASGESVWEANQDEKLDQDSEVDAHKAIVHSLLADDCYSLH